MISLLLFCLISSTTLFAEEDVRVIYGGDSRVDIYQAPNEFYVDLAHSTAAKILKTRLNENSDGTFSVEGRTLGAKKKLCKDERFYHQQTGASCAGFLVAPNLIVTAGHCANSQEKCDAMNWVFGFSISIEGDTADKILKEDIYSCKEVVDWKNEKNNDYALVRLDRDVIGRIPLSIRRDGKIHNSTRLMIIGHPTGLPTKLAFNGKVRDNSGPTSFMTNTDSFSGNSGSPVIDQSTGQVEGILVGGETDYTYDWNAKCRRPYRCPEDLCRGERVTRITNIEALLSILN